MNLAESKLKNTLRVRGSCPHVCASCVACQQRPKEGVRFPELKLPEVVSGHVGVGNQAWVFHKSSKCSPAFGECRFYISFPVVGYNYYMKQ